MVKLAKNKKPTYKSKKAQQLIQKEVYSNLVNASVEEISNDIKYYMNTKSGIDNSFKASQEFVRDSGRFPLFGEKARGFCKKIYGKKVKDWSFKKQIDTYSNLMAGEINDIYKTGCFKKPVDLYTVDYETGQRTHTKYWGK